MIFCLDRYFPIWIDIRLTPRYFAGMTDLLHKAVIFDRDEVLNIDIGYPHRVEDCKIIPGADLALKLVNDRGYKAYIATNQGGIALGYYDENAMHKFNEELKRQLGAAGGVISGVAFCPHHPRSPNPALHDCACRKPKPGMLLALAEQYHIDLKASLMIGDRVTDVEAGEAAGCTGHLFTGGNLFDFLTPIMDELS